MLPSCQTIYKSGQGKNNFLCTLSTKKFIHKTKKFPRVTYLSVLIIAVKLFEYDKRFASVAGKDFVYFDYKSPMTFGQLASEEPELCLREYFDVIIADPPFLSEECMTKTSVTVRYLAKKEAKILYCTGNLSYPYAIW